MKSNFVLQYTLGIILFFNAQLALATECATASLATCGVSLSGTTTGDPSSGTGEGTCGTADGTTGTTWYYIIGNGFNWSAETVATAGQYDTKIWVFTGTCGALTCVTGNDDGGSGLLSRVDFATTNGTTYYIVVGGYSSSEGNFLLNIDTDGACGAGCTSAIPTTCGVSMFGSTIGDVSTGTGEGTCGTTDGTAGTIWYSIEGDGSTWTVETVATTGQYDTKIWVFTGSCGALTCVGGDDNSGTGSLSLVSFLTTDSTTYFITVGGSGAAEGAYQLDITNSGYCGSECLNATSVDCGTVLNGNTTGQSISSLGTCTTSQGTGGVEWYTFNGDGNTWDFEVTAASFDTKLWVYSGSCNSLICETGDDDGGVGTLSMVNFSTVQNVTYFVIVGGYSSGEGTYTLDVSSTPCAGPGGIRSGLQVWLKADKATKSDNPVTSWGNEGPNSSVIQLVSATGTTIETGASLNYNRGLRMSGGTNGQSGIFSTATSSRTDLLPGNELSMFSVYADGVSDMSMSFHSQSDSVNEWQSFSFGDASVGTLFSSGTANQLTYASTDNRSTNILGMKGTASGAGTNSVNGIQSTSTDVGVFTTNSNPFDLCVGLIPGSANDNITAENIVFDRELTAVEFHKVESYLAIKYGVTLGLDGTSQDYNLSDNSVVWNQSANSGFAYSIAMIARDDNSALNQQKSRSSNGSSFGTFDDILAVSHGINFSAPTVFSSDLSAFSWGNNGSPIVNTSGQVSITSDNSETLEAVFDREWKAQETGTVGTVTLEFDLNGLLGSSGVLESNDLQFLRLLVDEDGDFTNGATSISPSSYNNSTDIVYFQHDFVPTSGTNSDLNNGFYFTLASVDFTQAPLPVELSKFNVTANDCAIDIDWTTISELNCKQFSIERSYDSDEWEEIGSLAGLGNSNAVKNYSYRDNDFQMNGLIYYRLIQEDIDGVRNQVGLKVVKAFCRENIEPIAYPNPVSNVLSVKSPIAGMAIITDLNGRVMVETELTEGVTSLSVDQLVPGTYLLQLTLFNGKSYVDQFIKL